MLCFDNKVNINVQINEQENKRVRENLAVIVQVPGMIITYASPRNCNGNKLLK